MSVAVEEEIACGYEAAVPDDVASLLAEGRRQLADERAAEAARVAAAEEEVRRRNEEHWQPFLAAAREHFGALAPYVDGQRPAKFRAVEGWADDSWVPVSSEMDAIARVPGLAPIHLNLALFGSGEWKPVSRRSKGASSNGLQQPIFFTPTYVVWVSSDEECQVDVVPGLGETWRTAPTLAAIVALAEEAEFERQRLLRDEVPRRLEELAMRLRARLRPATEEEEELLRAEA